LTYILNRPGCTHVLVGARKVTHAIENAQAADLHLTTGELEKIDALFSEHMEGLELST
jgi:aryl-alcohol dehydrogenase-like predicted oxidoreductase